MKQVLSIEQMQHLQDLGLDVSNASAAWLFQLDLKKNNIAPMFKSVLEGYDNYIPAYTLQDVLEHLPVKLGVNGKIHITRDFLTSAWTVEYFEGATLGRVSFDNEELIDAAYDMLCLLVEKGYVKNKA